MEGQLVSVLLVVLAMMQNKHTGYKTTILKEISRLQRNDLKIRNSFTDLLQWLKQRLDLQMLAKAFASCPEKLCISGCC